MSAKRTGSCPVGRSLPALPPAPRSSSCTPISARAAAGQAHLRIMETTDLHVHVWPYDYYADKAVDTLGLARTAAHIKAIRAEATNSLLLDNGDFLQGNPMGDYMAYEKGMKDGRPASGDQGAEHRRHRGLDASATTSSTTGSIS